MTLTVSGLTVQVQALIRLLKVSNDPTHTLYTEFNPAFAYVRPHDLDVTRFTPGTAHTGIVAKLTHAIVVGPVARLELDTLKAGMLGKDAVIEAQLSASQCRQQDFKEGGALVLTPRKAGCF